jgi:hypothetical protein
MPCRTDPFSKTSLLSFFFQGLGRDSADAQVARLLLARVRDTTGEDEGTAQLLLILLMMPGMLGLLAVVAP